MIQKSEASIQSCKTLELIFEKIKLCSDGGIGRRTGLEEISVSINSILTK